MSLSKYFNLEAKYVLVSDWFSEVTFMGIV